MENAGAAVAKAAQSLLAELAASRQGALTVLVICGRGANGGDGFVAARLLSEMGYLVRVALLGSITQLRGDAAMAAADWQGAIEVAGPDSLNPPVDLIIDAILGAGLKGTLSDDCATLISAINGSQRRVLSVDVPSGLDGTRGSIASTAVEALETVTFVRRKPGHLLLPGRLACGKVTVADIGMPESVVAEIDARTFGNEPDLWLRQFPRERVDQHKYDRGHAVVVAGAPENGGAARLGARAALRVGAGLVTLVAAPEAVPINACHLNAIMVRTYDGAFGLGKILADHRKNAVLIGPGLGVDDQSFELTLTSLRSNAAVVVDADAISSAALDTPRFFDGIKRSALRPVVLTPHEGEFSRLFPGLAGSKLERARAASALSGAIVVLKGPDTVIAEPAGRAAINHNAPPSLATAGSGDVLAGMITGLLAQGMPAFEAAASAVWMHGEAAKEFGRGLISEDLPEMLPRVLRRVDESAAR